MHHKYKNSLKILIKIRSIIQYKVSKKKIKKKKEIYTNATIAAIVQADIILQSIQLMHTYNTKIFK